MNLIARVRSTIRRYGMLNPGDKVVVAVSGGPDSVLLLRALLTLREEFSLGLHVAHVNHQLRGTESARDEAFVTDLALSLGLPISRCRVNVRQRAREEGLSLEDASRRARYEFLGAVARKFRARKIATGHTASDQAETVLLRLLRGAGGTGLAGIPPVREGKIIRPLIDLGGTEVREFLHREGIAFRRDSSNTQQDVLRNRVRLHLIPLLEKEFNPKIQQALARTARLLSEDDATLGRAAVQALRRAVRRRSSGQLALALPSLLKYNQSTQSRILREALRDLRGDILGLGFRHIDALLGLAGSGRTGAKTSLPGGVVASRGYGELVLDLKPSPCPDAAETSLLIPGRTDLRGNGLVLVSELLGRQPSPRDLKRKDRVYLDADAFRSPLLVRTRKEGDRFQPFGLAREKKLKKVLIDDRIPRDKRQQLPLLVDGAGTILWIVGHRRSEKAKVTKGTRRILEIRAAKRSRNPK
jgi:tRNA(Ile)-lysidine synthase